MSDNAIAKQTSLKLKIRNYILLYMTIIRAFPEVCQNVRDGVDLGGEIEGANM